MEVVLSPGRFGDETPGVPFQNEEIREWSHVDRLTGMLERARVETGRWQTSSQGAARSYGKVIDSRERNSADGSVVQRARRQVEIFQSQGRGRSVQVVRASQWSSSRVTESCTTTPPTLSGLEKNEEEKFVNSSRLETSEKSFSHQDAISERLGALLGTLASSSTVPMRRIDSKYSSRAAILKNQKRSNSNEDLPSLEKNSTRRSHTIENEARMFSRMDNHDRENMKYHEIVIDADRDEKNRTKIAKSAIHLLPSSKSNTTVVNLIKDSRAKNENDNVNSKCPNVNWSFPASSNLHETCTSNSENLSSRKDENIDAPSLTSGLPGKSIKRVGFCKTEIHFAADSGKVNIVETDEKPPPSNKFRRRRRLTGITNKILPIVDSTSCETKIDDKIENSMNNDEKTRFDVQRGHTTTVKLGSEITKKDVRGFPDGQYCARHHENSSFPETLEASGQGILLRRENRIYDRLETYTSNYPLNTSISNTSRVNRAPEIEIQTSALKSARLVMNLTKNSNISKIIVDKNILKIDDEKQFFDIETNICDDSTRMKIEDNSMSDYRDWQDDDEVKSIMLERVDGKMSSEEFITGSGSKEPENNDENNQSLIIVDDKREKNEKSEGDKKSSLAPASLIKTYHLSDDYDVVCTDAENNQVLLKVVTTHEPTIARVENDHYRKFKKKSSKLEKSSNHKKSSKFEKFPNHEISSKLEKSSYHEKTSKNQLAKKKNLQNEHTYVNVFTGSQNAPIYENYKITESNGREIKKNFNPVKNDGKSLAEKISRVPETKNHSNDLANTRELENTNMEKTKTVIDEISSEITISSVNSSLVSKKTRTNMRENKLPIVNEKSSGEFSSSNSTNSAGNLRLKTSKITKNSVTKGAPIDNKNSISSCDRDSRLANKISNDEKKCCTSKSSTREASTTRIRKNETKQKPMEVVYQTAVYNMKNEKLTKPQKGKESRGPRCLNELICGAKTKKPSDSKSKSKASSMAQHSTNNKGASQTVRHWK